MFCICSCFHDFSNFQCLNYNFKLKMCLEDSARSTNSGNQVWKVMAIKWESTDNSVGKVMAIKWGNSGIRAANSGNQVAREWLICGF